MSFRWSYFVPFLLRRVVLRRSGPRGVLPLLQFLADHPDFEQNSSRFNLLADGFELLRSNFLRTMRDVQEYAFQFVERAGKPGITLLQRGLAIQAGFLGANFPPPRVG